MIDHVTCDDDEIVAPLPTRRPPLAFARSTTNKHSKVEHLLVNEHTHTYSEMVHVSFLLTFYSSLSPSLQVKGSLSQSHSS